MIVHLNLLEICARFRGQRVGRFEKQNMFVDGAPRRENPGTGGRVHRERYQAIENLMRSRPQHVRAADTYLLGIKILFSVPRNMFREAVNLETMLYCYINHLFQGARRVFAELTRVRMQAVRHRKRLVGKLNWRRLT